jgi:periplasmic divalent cation tolerance protein
VSEPQTLQVFCTIGSEPRARDLAAGLVQDRLAACVQVVGPIHSTYRWRDTVESATEWLLLMKTTSERFAALRDAIVARHPYDVPEIVAVPIAAGLPGYLDWIRTSVIGPVAP